MGAAGNFVAAEAFTRRGKVASPQAMTEGVIIGTPLSAKARHCGKASAWRKRAEPSPSLLRKSTSPERGRFCSTYRKVPKSSPFGGAVTAGD